MRIMPANRNQAQPLNQGHATTDVSIALEEIARDWTEILGWWDKFTEVADH